jgi:hypothetical protein
MPRSLALVIAAIVNAEDVSGKWSGFPIYLTLKQEGSKVTGTGGQTADDQIPFPPGTIEDNHLTLTFGPMNVSLVVNGDVMSGEVHQGTNVMKIVLKRMKPRNPSDPPPTFDAATVKREPPPELGKGTSSSMHADPGRLTCTNVSLRRLIIAAWSLKDYQFSGPAWLNDLTYDVTATMPPGTPTDEVMQMLQTLLTERFGLVIHREPKDLSVYALVVDKGGVKLKAADGPGGTSIS